MRLIIAILMLGVLWATPSYAQTKENVLRGAKTIYVAIDLSATAIDKCFIKLDDIVSAYKFPFSNSKLVLSDSIIGSDLYLYININPMDIHIRERVTGCAFAVSFEVRSFIRDAIPFNGKRETFFAELLTFFSVHTASVSSFRNYVREVIEDYSKKFITAYNLDNK